MHPDGYIAILRLLDVTDDTVISQKSVLAELLVSLPSKSDKVRVDITGTPIEKDDDEDEGEKPPLLDLALSETAHKLFVFLLANTDTKRKKYFDPSELEILRQNPVVTLNSEEVPTSKKNPNTRRLELLQYLKEALVELCTSHADILLRSRYGSKVFLETFEAFPSSKLVSAIVDTCGDEPGEKSGLSSMLEDVIGHMTVKNMIVHESESQSKGDSNDILLARALYEKYKGKLLDTIACSNRGAFVLLAMSEVLPEVKAEIGSKKNKIQKIIKAGSNSSAGYHALMKAIS